MRLTELSPEWVNIYTPPGETPRTRAGLKFLCPHCRKEELHVMFANPIDPGEPFSDGPTWQRTGDTFDTLTLSPSVDASRSGHWHGFIRNGEVA